MKPMHIEVNIEELVLHGFAPGNHRRIADSFERELKRLFSAQGAPPAVTRSEEIARFYGGAFEMKPGSTAESTGIQLANLIYGGFGK